MAESLIIEEWLADHARWPELLRVVETAQQTAWFAAQMDWHRSSQVLVATKSDQIVGFLRFVIQMIGADDDHDPVLMNGTPLIEAKVVAFGVVPECQRQGIGRALQRAALTLAKQRGCYQLRSHSSGTNSANHQLKLSMGFGVHPIRRGDDNGGVYFVMPLQAIGE